jgi:dTDP-4-amino-4,6-dideoxygalactose transaminase
MPFGRADQAASSHHLAVVLLPPETERSEIQAALRDVGIQTSVHYPPIHRFSAYAAIQSPRSLPTTELVADRILTLPLFAHMRDEQVDAVCEALVSALAVNGAAAGSHDRARGSRSRAGRGTRG